jgi:mRNA-degrading endonuclease RelE of RelBE toxin-antitoxin system
MSESSLLERISAGIAEADAGNISHWTVRSLVNDLDDLWHPQPPEMYLYRRASKAAAPCTAPDFYDYEPKPPPPKRPPPWYIGMSSNFSKDISKIDRKLQGRILEALNELTQNPISLRGDTVKPLTGELQGCWRYRLGDYRLIYSPDRSTGDITLLAFASRGSAYAD